MFSPLREPGATIQGLSCHWTPYKPVCEQGCNSEVRKPSPSSELCALSPLEISHSWKSTQPRTHTEELTIRLLALLPRPSYRALKLSAGEAHLLLRNQRHRHAAPALPWTRRPAPHTPEEPGGQSSAAAATTATG